MQVKTLLSICCHYPHSIRDTNIERRRRGHVDVVVARAWQPVDGRQRVCAGRVCWAVAVGRLRELLGWWAMAYLST